MDLIQDLAWELSVLSRSVAYNNLSGASAQVGISQPQLSRIVSKLEESLGIVLLDRTVRRRSAWTPAASRLAELYSKAARNLQQDMQKMTEGVHLREVRVGTLEGLSSVAMAFANHLFTSCETEVVDLDIYDLSALEEGFMKENLDFIFTIREIGRKKPTFIRTLGAQRVIKVDKGLPYTVVSPYEFSARLKQKVKGKVLISNSLEIRKTWLDTHGGRGWLPSTIQKGEIVEKDRNEVFLLGSEQLTSGFWDKASVFKF
ncbi:MAG: LysR family transcriptional regulator [Bdellovibrionia bacterium]